MSMQSIKNRHAKKKDLNAVYCASVDEANINTSAMMRLLVQLLIDHGILTYDEVNELMRLERIEVEKENIRRELRAIEEQGVG